MYIKGLKTSAIANKLRNVKLKWSQIKRNENANFMAPLPSKNIPK